MNHTQLKLERERKPLEGYTEPPEAEATRTEIRMAFDLGQAVHDRRAELGISQTELAQRANMTQLQISKLEIGGTVPSFPLLARLTKALDAPLDIALDGDTSTVAFAAHATDHTAPREPASTLAPMPQAASPGPPDAPASRHSSSRRRRSTS